MKHYTPAYAIVRMDTIFKAEGVVGVFVEVVVKEVVWSEEEAKSEVARLNELNNDKGLVYSWQYTRVKKENE